MAELTVGGTSYTLAPLRYRQVNKVVLSRDKASKEEIQDAVQRGIAFSLKNTGAFPDKSVDELMDFLDEQLPALEHSSAWVDVLKITGLTKDEPGEDLAALSTSTESAAE